MSGLGSWALGEETLGGGVATAQEITPGTIDSEEHVTGPHSLGYPHDQQPGSLGVWQLGRQPLGGATREIVPTLFAGTIDSEEHVTGPALLQEVAILSPGSIASGEVVTGGTLVHPPPPPPDPPPPGEPIPAQPPRPPRVGTVLVGRDGTVHGPLHPQHTQSEEWDRGWQEQLNDTGAGRVNIQHSSPALAQVDFNKLIRFTLDGVARFAVPVERLVAHTVAEGEEHDEYTEVEGRGHVSLWDEMIVLPPNGLERRPFADTRWFNFAAPHYDAHAWHTPVATPPNYDGPDAPGTAEGINYGFPESWPDVDSAWLWDRLNDMIGTPAGVCYFRTKPGAFTLASPKTVQVWAAADDEHETWLDGIPLLHSEGVYRGQSTHVTVDLSAGEHVIAARVRNLNALKAGYTLTVLEVAADGTLGDVLHRTTVAGWRMLAYPPTIPGFTPGEILRVLLEEAQDRGAMAGWQLAFIDQADTNGEPWEVTEDFSIQIGADGLEVLRQLAEGYVDFAAVPGALVLRAWVAGRRGQPTAVTWTPGENITELTHEVEG